MRVRYAPLVVGSREWLETNESDEISNEVPRIYCRGIRRVGASAGFARSLTNQGSGRFLRFQPLLSQTQKEGGCGGQKASRLGAIFQKVRFGFDNGGEMRENGFDGMRIQWNWKKRTALRFAGIALVWTETTAQAQLVIEVFPSQTIWIFGRQSDSSKANYGRSIQSSQNAYLNGTNVFRNRRHL